jgi:hypothetical protein
MPIDNIAYAIPADIAVRIAMQITERDKLTSGKFVIGKDKDCLLLPSVGITLDGLNKRSALDHGISFYEEDITVYEVGAGENGCKLELNSGDIIRRVECDGKIILPKQSYEIREFLIECYDADEITVWVERANEADEALETDENGYYKITGGFAGVTNGRPPRKTAAG